MYRRMISAKCVAMGMSKINVGTGLKKVYTDAVREAIKTLPETEYDPRKIAGPGRKAIAAEIASKKMISSTAAERLQGCTEELYG